MWRARTLLIGIVLLGASAAWSGEPTIAIVVHPSREAALSLRDVRRVFLKQRRFWADGEPIVVVNHRAGNALRDAFTRAVLGRTADQLARYWNEQYFRSVLPPITLSSDRAIVRYVAVRSNAIGYVDARAVDDSVRVVQRLR